MQKKKKRMLKSAKNCKRKKCVRGGTRTCNLGVGRGFDPGKGSGQRLSILGITFAIAIDKYRFTHWNMVACIL